MIHTKLTSKQIEQLNRLKEIHSQFDKLAREHHEIGESLRSALPNDYLRLGLIVMAIAPIEKGGVLQQESKHDLDNHHSYCLCGDTHSLSVGLADFILKNSNVIEVFKQATGILISHEIARCAENEKQSKNN